MQPSRFIKIDHYGNQIKSQWFNSQTKTSLDIPPLIRPRYIPVDAEKSRNIVKSNAQTISKIKKQFQSHTIIKKYQKLQTQAKLFFQDQGRDSKGFTVKNIRTSIKKKRYQQQQPPQQRIFTAFSHRKRILSQQKFRPCRQQKYQMTTIDTNMLRAKITNAQLFKKRDGLRWKLKTVFANFGQGDSNIKNMKQFINDVKNGLNYNYKNIYLFHLNRQPISKLSDIHKSEYSIFIDKCAKISLPAEIYTNLNEQIQIIQKNIKQVQSDLGISREEYEESILEPLDIKQYVQKIIDNPNQTIDFNKDEPKQLNSINQWYDKGLRQFSNSRNMNYQELKGRMNQKVDLKPLQLSRLKLQKSNIIMNPHKYKIHPTNLLIENVKHDKQLQAEKSINNSSKKQSWIQKNIKSVSYSQKSIYDELMRKNSELFHQNIPYIIQKYNISRLDAHHLYTLYKSLEQISAIRLKKKVEEILKNGIDRSTFDEGLNGLGISVNKQVIKNICHFDEYINWPQFLKILSISASKTPEQKLNAILKYVNEDNSSESLSKLQMDVLISASLGKFLGDTKETGFSQMKQYFMTIIFEELDVEKEGKIKIDRLKKRILQKQNQSDLISFLFLANEP